MQMLILLVCPSIRMGRVWQHGYRARRVRVGDREALRTAGTAKTARYLRTTSMPNRDDDHNMMPIPAAVAQTGKEDLGCVQRAAYAGTTGLAHDRRSGFACLQLAACRLDAEIFVPIFSIPHPANCGNIFSPILLQASALCPSGAYIVMHDACG